MPSAKPKKASPSPAAASSAATGKDLTHSALEFLQHNREQEEAVSEVVHAAIDGVLRLIRSRELDVLSEDHAIAIAASDTAQVYAASAIRPDPGDTKTPTTTTAVSVAQQKPDGPPAYEDIQGDRDEQHRHQVEVVAGTLGPGLEPQPAAIDRWARGWVASRSVAVRKWNRGQNPGANLSDDWSEGGKSTRVATSTKRQISWRPHKNDPPGVPFPLGPDDREDQGLPPTMPRQGKRRGGGGGARGGGGGGGGGRRGTAGEGNDGGNMGGGNGNNTTQSGSGRGGGVSRGKMATRKR